MVKVAPEHPGTKLLALVVADPDLIVTALADADVDVDPDDVAEQISVVAEPKDGIVTITAAADSNSDADRLVKSLIAQGAAVTRMGINQAEDGIDYSFGDFEHGIGVWDNLPSSFNRRPRDVSIVSPGFTNAKALSVHCDAEPTCGPSLILRGLFVPERVYTAVAYARSADSDSGLSLILGTNSDDFAGGTSKSLTPDWQRFGVRWSPSEIRARASLAVRVDGADESEFEIDSVVLSEGPAPRGLQPSGSGRRSARFESGWSDRRGRSIRRTEASWWSSEGSPASRSPRVRR